MASREETQDNREPAHEAQNGRAGDHESPTIPTGQPKIKPYTANHKKDHYFRDFGNWVSLLTLLFVAAYTVITFAQWRSNHIFNKKQLRAIDIQLSEIRGASQQTDQTIAALKAQTGIMHDTLTMSQRPWLYVTGNISFGNIVQNSNPRNKIRDVAVSVDVVNKGNSIAIDVGGGGQLKARQFTLDNRFSKIETSDIPCSDIYEGGRIPPFEFARDKFAIPPQAQQRLSFHTSPAPEGLSVHKRALPYFAGCIQYRWPLKGETFSTLFLVPIGFVDQKTNTISPFYEMPDAISEIRPVGPINYIDAR